MNLRIICGLLPLFFGMAGQRFDKSAFYATMSKGDLEGINSELVVVVAASIPEEEAYEGALLMKKSGLLSRPMEKLRSFKSGRIKLEAALLKDSTNGEYHFLRLAVQEHAPGIVRYSQDLEKDSYYIHHTFKALAPAVQKAIIDYSKHSKTLRPEDFDPEKK